MLLVCLCLLDHVHFVIFASFICLNIVCESNCDLKIKPGTFVCYGPAKVNNRSRLPNQNRHVVAATTSGQDDVGTWDLGCIVSHYHC